MIWMRLLPYAAAGALVIGVWFHGQATGRKLCQGEQLQAVVQSQSATIRASELASRKEAERLIEAAKAASLAQELEDMANADVEGTGCSFPARRVLRLNRY